MFHDYDYYYQHRLELEEILQENSLAAQDPATPLALLKQLAQDPNLILEVRLQLIPVPLRRFLNN